MAKLGATTYTAVTWTTGDTITEAKLDNMVANDQAYDSHAAQGLLLNNDKAYCGKETGGTARDMIYMGTDDNIKIGNTTTGEINPLTHFRMVSKFLGLGASSELTISGGVVTATRSYHSVDTEGDAATDDLDTINGGTEGDLLVLRSANTGRDVTVKNNSGNIFCGSDRLLSSTADRITLIFFNNLWFMMGFGDNA